MICGWCNTANIADADFCKRCGKKVEANGYKEFKKDIAYAAVNTRLKIRQALASCAGISVAFTVWATHPSQIGWALGCVFGWLAGVVICRTTPWVAQAGRVTKIWTAVMFMYWVFFALFGLLYSMQQYS